MELHAPIPECREGISFGLAGERLVARPSGALWWPVQATLVVSDLHLGKSERMARRGGPLLPPYEVVDTLSRLDAEIAALAPRRVVALGDSFDDMDAVARLDGRTRDWLIRLGAGRDWIWVTGNHDPAPPGLGGREADAIACGTLTFRHIAEPDAGGEVSGHYHPKAAIAVRGRAVSRPCFLRDARRLILPAFGTYTGGLRTRDRAFATLMAPDACAILTGRPMVEIPMPR